MELASLIFMIGRLMRDGARTKKPRTCSVLHFQTLQYVKERRRPLMRDVAGYLLITPPAATLLIETLVKEKLLKRIIDRNDRRAVRVLITKKGNALLAHCMKGVTQKLVAVFSVLSEKERRELVVLLEKVVENQ
jgi:DNA-binding MarR family transcriptional regulator